MQVNNFLFLYQKSLPMSVKQIDLLNIFLILISGALAYLFPLELFIFAFAILGPLHYLTEINWLTKEGFYIEWNKIIWALVGVVVSLTLVLPKLYFTFDGSADSIPGQILLFVNKWSNTLIFFAIIGALIATVVKSNFYRIPLILFAIIIAFNSNGTEDYSLILGLYVPTVIHVYFFTLLFMLYGARKNKSRFGLLSVLTALIIPLVIIYVPIDQGMYHFSDTMKGIYTDNRFHVTGVSIAKTLGLSDGTTFFFYEKIELRLMMFISFIYLYHYLNWFSKTTTIKWHKNLTTGRTITIMLLWIIMLALFYYDFKTGFIVSLFFSFLHVILELPLNMLSIREVLRIK